MSRPVPLAAATAVGSLGLLALAVALGWLGPDVDRGAVFCEVSDGPLAQPVNTLSNLGFVVAGLAVAARAGRPGGLDASTMGRRPGLATAYACLVVLLGPASMAMHATESGAGRSPRHAEHVPRRGLRGGVRRDTGVWHLLCALSAYCLFRLYASERSTTEDQLSSRWSAPPPPSPTPPRVVGDADRSSHSRHRAQAVGPPRRDGMVPTGGAPVLL